MRGEMSKGRTRGQGAGSYELSRDWGAAGYLLAELEWLQYFSEAKLGERLMQDANGIGSGRR